MAKYLILITGQESDARQRPSEWDQMMQAHGQFAQAVDQQGGKILGGEGPAAHRHGLSGPRRRPGRDR